MDSNEEFSHLLIQLQIVYETEKHPFALVFSHAIGSLW